MCRVQVECTFISKLDGAATRMCSQRRLPYYYAFYSRNINCNAMRCVPITATFLLASKRAHTRTQIVFVFNFSMPPMSEKRIRKCVVRECITHSLPPNGITNKTKFYLRLTDLIQCAVKSRKWRITVYDACAMCAAIVCRLGGRPSPPTTHTHSVGLFSAAHCALCLCATHNTKSIHIWW